MKSEKGFSLIEVIIVCMVLAIVASAVIPSAWKFYRQAAVEYESEHLLSDLRRAQSMSRLTAERAWEYGAKNSQKQWASLQICERYSYLMIGLSGGWNGKLHYYLPAIRISRSNSQAAATETISFDANGKPVNNSMMTFAVYCKGYPKEARYISISRGGRIRMKREQG